jgi:flagellar operon protein
LTEKSVHIPYLPAQRELTAVKKPRLPGGEGKFDQILEEALIEKKLNFSAHARQRLASRKITLDEQVLGKLNKAVDKAAEKGCRSSLLLYGDMAFVAGVPTRTIITALDGESMKEHVFTNIDSALVVE